MIDTGVEGLKYVRGALTRVKETARLALAAAQHNYDGRLSEEQEAVALAADIVIEAYAVESALLRVEKMIARAQASGCLCAHLLAFARGVVPVFFRTPYTLANFYIAYKFFACFLTPRRPTEP